MKDKNQPPEMPMLDSNTASQMLDNILVACDAEPNTVPLTILSSYSNYRKDRYLFQKIILILIILLFCLLPLFFIPPEFSVVETTKKINQPSFEIQVESFLPVERIEAKINDSSIPVYETGEKLYSVEPTQNGVLEIKVVLKNRQSSTETFEVTTVDLTPPDVVSSRSDAKHIYIYLQDDLSGIDYENITAKDLNGADVSPQSYDQTTDCVVFEYPETSLNLIIPDKAGNTVQIILTTKE